MTQSPLRFIKGYFFPLILLSAGILIVSKKEQLFEIGSVVSRIRVHFLLAAAAFQFLTYLFEAKSYNVLLGLWRTKAGVILMAWRLVASRFIGRSVPSLSIAGSVYVATKLQKEGLSKNEAIQTVLQATVNYYLAILIFAASSYLYLWVTDQLAVIEVVFFVLFAVVAAGMFFMGYFGAKRHGRLGVYYQRVINRLEIIAGTLLRIFGLNNGNNKVQQGPDEPVSSGIKSAPMFIPRALLWAIVRFVADSATMYFVFLGFDFPVRFSAVMVGFSVATIAGIVSIFPGGIGQFEAVQIFIFTSFGIPLHIAIAATTAYRLLSFWLPIPLGAYFYKKEERAKSILRLAR